MGVAPSGVDFRSRRGGRLLSYLGLAILALSVTLGSVAFFYPHRWHVGPLVIALRHTGRPIGFSLAGFVLWYFTVDRRRRSYKFFRRRLAPLETQLGAARGRCFTAWRFWDWRQRLFLVITGSNLVVMAIDASHYPQHLQQDQDNRNRSIARAQRGKEPQLEHFARMVVQQTPADARILFQGRTAGMRFAFEVYPRRVFMLPQDYRAMATQWHVQSWLKDPPVDRHESYWHRFIPQVYVPADDFVRAHRITYLARFDELDLSQCKLERLQ